MIRFPALLILILIGLISLVLEFLTNLIIDWKYPISDWIIKKRCDLDYDRSKR